MTDPPTGAAPPETFACPRCGVAIDRADRFRRACGAEVLADARTVDAYLAQILPGRVDAALKERVRDQKIVEVEAAELLAERAMKWLCPLGFFLGIPVVLITSLSFVGLKTYSDIQRAADQAAELDKQLVGPQQQLTRVNQELGRLQTDLDKYRKWINGRAISRTS